MQLKVRKDISDEQLRLILGSTYACLHIEGMNVIFEDSEDFESFIPVLAEAIAFPKEWYIGEVEAITRKAVIETKRVGKTGSSDFLAELIKQASPLLNEKSQLYSMWTKINIKDSHRQSLRFKVGCSTVVISSEPSRGLRLEPYFINGLGDIDPSYPPGGMVISARGEARSALQAGNNLYGPISDLTNLLNFAFHRRVRQRHLGRFRPKANVLLGDKQFVFCGSQTLNSNRLWFNPEFKIDFWERPGLSFAQLKRDEIYVRAILSSLRRKNFGERVMASIRMMVDGWSSHDINARLFRSWTAYEILLSRSKERADPYEQIVRRAVFMAKDRELWTLRLRHAARSRNQVVHQNAAVLAAENVAETLERYLSSLIHWILFSNFRLSNHENLLDLLDSSVDLSTLGQQIRVRRQAKHILEH